MRKNEYQLISEVGERYQQLSEAKVWRKNITIITKFTEYHIGPLRGWEGEIAGDGMEEVVQTRQHSTS